MHYSHIVIINLNNIIFWQTFNFNFKFSFLCLWICLLWFTFKYLDAKIRLIKKVVNWKFQRIIQFEINLALQTLKQTPLVLYVSTQKRSGFTLVVSFEFQFNKKHQKLYLSWLPNLCIEYAIWVLSGFSNFSTAYVQSGYQKYYLALSKITGWAHNVSRERIKYYRLHTTYLQN